MSENRQHLDTINDIRQMMQKSSRFISLSGLSGISAGLCALVGAWIAYGKIGGQQQLATGSSYDGRDGLAFDLVAIAIVTFLAALGLAFLFTYIRSRKVGIPIWGFTARRVMFAVAVPMIAGGLLILRMLEMEYFGLVAPCCLIFYGLGLINAGKFTLDEIRYLGYCQLALGIANLWLPGWGLYFWAAGFGVLHILYGIIMWNKYERTKEERA
jgi:hypothetical protein